MARVRSAVVFVAYSLGYAAAATAIERPLIAALVFAVGLCGAFLLGAVAADAEFASEMLEDEERQ